ncbi:hypothetical protein NIIDMKKI_67600 [Mycobacterium kansasii]|uniref:Amidohydrolase 3 domain-containing protein n=1 Tax=Mycobacterium kansasii TaxID=1768 RepID=A0A7G1IMF3_MYCKA|nr:hypothetical protein NIIDMKKI_67600 [Mycobacterium kansasii]
MTYDLLIRNGTIVDGLGGEPYVGDVAVRDGVIKGVGVVNGGTAKREIDATGLLVTPGFVDLHTHYDGQAIWSDRLTPSSAHGVTTVVMGNCGVGFAPCRQEDHDVLVDVMAGVEDIPGVVMTDGLPWTWETFPDYLNALEAGRRDIDVAVYLPHSPLRVYVMGQRGADREPATPQDLAAMRALAKEAIEAGALGFASSRLTIHKTESGSPIPSYDAAREEIEEIARGVVDGGGGLLQFVPDIPAGGYQPVLQMVFDVAEDVGLPVTFTLVVANVGDPTWPDAITMIEKANGAGGDITAQLLPRPIGLIIGLQLSANPFVLYPSYREIMHLPLAERVAEMRKPDVRARILADKPGVGHPILYVAQAWDWIFPLGDNPDYEPDPSGSIGARARARGEPDGGGIRPAARRRRSRHAAGRHEQPGEQLAGHRRQTAAPRRRGARPRRRRRPLRHDLRRQLLDVLLGALGARPGVRAVHGGRGRARTHLGTGPGGRAGRPRTHRRRLQGRPQCHRPRRAAAAQAGHPIRPAGRRTAPGPDRRGLRRNRRLGRGDRRERGAHRRATRQAGPRTAVRSGPRLST